MSDQNNPQTHTRTLTDTRTPLGAKLTQGGKPIDLTGLTVYATMESDDGTVEQSPTVTGVTIQPTTTFTADVSGNRLVANDHRVEVGDQIIVATETTLPGGLAAATRYFARDVEDNSFAVATTRDGLPVTITSAGTGAHTYYVVGSVEYDFAESNVDVAGDYWFWFVVSEGGETDTFPHDGRKFKVVIVDSGD
jgi:hypothetical protein